MASKSKQKAEARNDTALQAFQAGYNMVRSHPIFAPLLDHANVIRREGRAFPQEGLATVSRNGYIYCNTKRRAAPEVWARVLAHCLLHLGMEHFVEKEHSVCWNVACDCAAEQFLSDLKFGKALHDAALPGDIRNEEKLYIRLCREGLDAKYINFGTAGNNVPDMIFDKPGTSRPVGQARKGWPAIFAEGLSEAVQSAVNVAAGYSEALNRNVSKSPAERAKAWFISSYPLLGAVAAGFEIITDSLICQRMGIRVAAISCELQEIFINPAAGLREEECRFVLAHEFLHAALRHDVRHEWREPYIWNVACDYVINGWLIEMELGRPPDGLLYDARFKGLSAEAVYDRIVTDVRSCFNLSTLRGVGLGDILPPGYGPGDNGNGRGKPDGLDLDAFYRRAIGQGLRYHQTEGRGYLPLGLIEEIRALSHPPIPWDVELARWFDAMFEPLEKTRSYARPSRRQSATPDIPRPNWVIRRHTLDSRTFGVVLDTSGSMERGLLAVALGAIAGYSAARDVPGVRVVFCDAEAYDQGYLKPEDVAGVVKVRGRGGTVLQPGIDLLLRAEDFPKDAPILIITDSLCEDRLILYGREHAFLIPKGARLPFVPKGKVFRMRY